MKRSLQRHLSLMLGSAILLAGLVAAIASFGLAYFDAKEFQDDMLRQIATLNLSGASNALRAPQSGASETESRILYLQLPRDPRPDWLPEDLQPGLHTLNMGNARLRVFVRAISPGKRIVVAQPTDSRDEIAIDSALRTLIPLLLLLPLLVWLIVRIVRRELAPIARLSKRLDEQPADRPQAIPDEHLPDEITPFVQAINRLLQRVNHLMTQQRRFIADAAHELRTPLTALSVQAQNVRQASSLEAVRERVTALQTGIERARQLTEQLLNLARSQAGTELESAVDVSALVRQLIAEYLPLAETKHIDLGLDEMAPLVIRTSPEALQLILKNALGNALKYTQDGGEVTLRLLTEPNGCVIEVVDNGPGIAVSERERVFDTFYRTPGSLGEGNGLGLPIAREAAIRLGGVVSLHTGLNNSGLIFRLQLQR